MYKTIIFCSLGALAMLLAGQTGHAFAQAPASQPPQAQPASRPAGVPDDPRLNLMIRNAIIALNQANSTGNYSVLRDMGTPAFQMANSSARLGEVFATLRARKLDLSPIMFFPPKLLSQPSLQDGQVLRLTGFFPTAPEQVNFDLAFQLFSDQWMLAGIAVNVALPSESPQASAASPAHTSADAAAPGKPGEAKPIRIDLSQPAPPPAQPVAAKKPSAAKKTKPPAQKTAAAQPSTSPAAPGDQAAPAPPTAAQGETATAAPPSKTSETGSSWNPFAR